MTTIPLSTLLDSIITLLTEAYEGPANPRESWFIDNEADSGILGVLSTLTAENASQSVDGSGRAGTTIAANVEHLRWSLANVNAALRGSAYNNDWKASWELTTADEAHWKRLQAALRQEFEELRQALSRQEQLPGPYLNGVIALIPHAAYHLGIIRQMIERVR